MKYKEVIFVILFLLFLSTNIYWWNFFQTTQEEKKTLHTQLIHMEEEIQTLRNTPREVFIPQPPLIVEKPVYIEKYVEKIVSPQIESTRMPVLAYNRNKKTGEVGFVEISLLPGKGDVLIDVRPFNAPAVQLSARNAVTAALREAKIQLKDKDIKIEFNIAAEAVGGESAGLAIGLASLSLLTKKPIKNYIAATGTIDEQGNVGKVGGILPKAEAASKKGTRLLLIPRGEGEILAYTPHYFINPETKEIVGKGDLILRKINVIREARSRWNVDVQQVSTLSEAVKYSFEDQKN